MAILRVLALVVGAILLLPGVCFLAVSGMDHGSDARIEASVGLVLLLGAIGLIWLGFRLEGSKGKRVRDDEGPKPEG